MRRINQKKLQSPDHALWETRQYLKSRLELLRGVTQHIVNSCKSNAQQEWAAEELMLRMLQFGEPENEPRSVENCSAELSSYLNNNPNPKRDQMGFSGYHGGVIVFRFFVIIG